MRSFQELIEDQQHKMISFSLLVVHQLILLLKLKSIENFKDFLSVDRLIFQWI